MKRLCVLLLALVVLCTADGVCARDTNGDGIETILLPLAFGGAVSDTVPGAYGTLWQGQTWMANTGSTTVFLNESLCPAECRIGYEPGFVGRVAEPLWIHPDRGVLLNPSVSEAAHLTFSARILELTRHAQPQGFQLPVIREGAFLTDPALFIGIPASGGVRAALRVYDPRRAAGASFIVDALDSAGKVLGTTVLTTTVSEAAAGEAIVPGFAMITDVAQYFGLPSSTDFYELRVRPLNTGIEYWGMVSVTDNDTQQVLIITPQ